jgi:hypothetical protein
MSILPGGSLRGRFGEFLRHNGSHSRVCYEAVYRDVQKSVPVKLARLLPDITIGCCFDSHPRIDSVLQRPGFRYGLLENAIGLKIPEFSYPCGYPSLVRKAE